MAECSLTNSEDKCNLCNPCNLTGWVVVYELAVIIMILLFIYSDLEKPVVKQTKIKTKTDTNTKVETE